MTKEHTIRNKGCRAVINIQHKLPTFKTKISLHMALQTLMGVMDDI